MVKIKCFIDSREQKRINAGKQYFSKYDPYVVEMVYGDYAFTDNDIRVVFEYKTIDDIRRKVDKYPQFGDMLKSYVDVCLTEQIESMAQTRQFDLSSFDFEPYKRFDEATHKKLELILK